MMHPVLDIANPFQSSPALPGGSNSGEVDPAVTPDWGAGEAYRVPAGYVLVPIDELKCWRDDLAYYRAREQQGSREQLPAFLENPSWQYLAAVERGAA